ncbi:MAG: 30S ribosomal protein S4 [Candidatus Thermoplasmatota archaeon]|jgi:small subunit ribosomal protein S4|nr:30S ribosomal protein S4 [Candidatus Thermoplasmatota archaeon]
MGKPKFSRKKYEKPSHPWQADRIQAENELIKKYGLKNKREIWKAESALKRYRSQARELLAKIRVGDPQTKKESEQLLTHLTRLNILPANPTLDDVLALNTESILSRRLQTVTYLKGLASTPIQARQLITHGHIAINGRKVTVPSYMVTKEEESNISYLVSSPLNDAMHPARPKPDFKSALVKKEDLSEKTKEQKTEKPKEKIQPEQITEKVDELKEEEKTVVEDKQGVKEGGNQDG